MGKIRISLAVAEADYGRSPISVLEGAERGELALFAVIGYAKSANERLNDLLVPVNPRVLLEIVREMGVERAFSEELEFSDGLAVKIFSSRGWKEEGSVTAVPSHLRLKENLFIELEPKVVLAGARIDTFPEKLGMFSFTSDFTQVRYLDRGLWDFTKGQGEILRILFDYHADNAIGRGLHKSELFRIRDELRLGRGGGEGSFEDDSDGRAKPVKKLIDIFRDKRTGIHRCWGKLVCKSTTESEGAGFYIISTFIPEEEDFRSSYKPVQKSI